MTDGAAPAIVKVLAPGTLVAGRYLLEERLGAGGGGTVWRCTDQQLGMTVALKIVADDVDLDRWRREVAMARRIAHRNVCRVHDLGETGELRYVTMELVEGPSLRSTIGHADAALARDRFEQLVLGVAAIHAAGVVHRDLKPENVVVGDDGRVVVVDFGLAREPRRATESEQRATVSMRASDQSADDHATVQQRTPTARSQPSPAKTVTQAGVVVGTPRYMSPEQAAGETVDARTDIWALGLVGHELLAGMLPGTSPEGRAVDPRVDEVWPGVAQILQRCLALEPEARFTDARELAAALARLPHGLSMSGDRTVIDPPREPARRRWRWVALGLGLAGGIAAVAIAIASGDRRERTEAVGSAPPMIDAKAADAASVTPATTVALERLTADPRRWPDDVVLSVAISRDGKRFAYTTLEPELYVAAVADPTRVVKWTAPRYRRPEQSPTSDFQTEHVTLHASGWFADGSLAVVATTRAATCSLYRVHADGRSTLLHQLDTRFVAAIAPDDRVAIGKPGEAVWLLAEPAPISLLALGPAERVAALAWSPDGKRLAVVRAPSGSASHVDARVQIVENGRAREVWTGPIAGELAPLLVWLDDGRLAFSANADGTQLHVASASGGAPVERARWTDELIAGGSAAAGTVLVLRGGWTPAVQVGDREANRLAPAVGNVPTDRLAGWLDGDQLVLATRRQIGRASPGKTFEPWPGTKPGVEIPDTVVDGSVIAHRIDQRAPADRGIVIERIDADGSRLEIARQAISSPVATPVRCAGDRTAPCLLQIASGGQVRFVALDHTTGKQLEIVHTRGYRAGTRVDFAVSYDGKVLAIADGGPEVVVVDRTGSTVRSVSTKADVEVRAPSFDPLAHLWVATTNHRGRWLGIGAFERRRSADVDYSLLFGRGTPFRDTARWVGRIAASPDGSRIAIEGRELRLHVARLGL